MALKKTKCRVIMATTTADKTPGPILIVEDDSLILELIEELLASTGRSVLAVSNGVEAREQVERHPELAAVITDLAMPEMDGTKLVEWLARERPGLPVVVVTGTSAQQSGGVLDRYKLLGVIRKPLTDDKIDQLLETLDSLDA